VSKLPAEVIALNGQVERLGLKEDLQKSDRWASSNAIHKENQFVQTRFKLLMHFRDNSKSRERKSARIDGVIMSITSVLKLSVYICNVLYRTGGNILNSPVYTRFNLLMPFNTLGKSSGQVYTRWRYNNRYDMKSELKWMEPIRWSPGGGSAQVGAVKMDIKNIGILYLQVPSSEWVYTKVYPKVSGLAAWNENCKWYSCLLLGTVVSLFCESV
jgi:hypothetical protein